MSAGTVLGVVFGIALALFVVISCYKSVHVVKEKEVKIIERLGSFKEVLTPGMHFVVPWVDRPKAYTFDYFISDARGQTLHVVKSNFTKVSTQNEVLDFPRQSVITRDNAMVYLDAILQYRVVNPKNMIYSTQNLPRMLSKILQAQLRNVAGMLDVDQIIEDTAALDRVSSEIDEVARRWGVQVEMVKIQKVEAGELTQVLAQKKNADLKNKEVIINAKSSKQTRVIEAEGHRDRMVKEAEGECSQLLSRARGQAQAILNQANAEARSVREIARAVSKYGEDPSKYLLAMKYTDALKRVASEPDTEILFMPHETAFLQTAQRLGLNTVLPSRSA